MKKYGAKKISRGRYKYKGYTLNNYGYYPPDHCIWWEAINDETGGAEYHAHTLRRLMQIIDSKKNK